LQNIFVRTLLGRDYRHAKAHFRHHPQQDGCNKYLRIEVYHLNRWGATVPLFILMFCLPFAMSGCGGSPASSSQQAGNLAITPGAVSFGTVPIGQTSFTNVSLTNQGATPATVSQVSITGQPFTVVGANELPVTVAAGDTYNFYVYFSPSSKGAASGQLTIASDSSSSATTSVNLSGTGDTASATAGLSGLICGNT
jgi:hypothetical protein